MRTSQYLFAGLASFALVGTAFAQDTPPDGEAPADPTLGTDPAATDPAATDPAATDPAAAATSRWPRDIISRPLTLPKGLAMVGADVGTFTSSFFDPAFLRVLGGYGITNELELAFAHYAFPTSDAGKGSIDAQIGYAFLRGAAGGKLEAVGRAQFGYSLLSEGLNPLGLGVHAQYNITPKLAVITPGGQLQIGLDDPNAITFGLPVSVGFQATPTLYLQLDTNLMTLAINEDAGDSAFIFADTTPLFVGGYFNVMPALDVFAGLGLNLTPPDTVDPVTMAVVEGDIGDTFALLLGARYYLGAL